MPRNNKSRTPQPVNMGSNILIVALTLCSVASSWGWREGSVVSEELFAAANPDAYLTAHECEVFSPGKSVIVLLQPELIAKKGYPAETHTVTTEDGYILTMHRIPYGKSGPSNNRPAVFVQHGLLCSSAAWVIMEPEKSLDVLALVATALIPTGQEAPSLPLSADVSLLVILEECSLVATSGQSPEGSLESGNTRGSTYSKEHVSLKSTDNEFWDFSWHESGVYDLPAMIDYVLSRTSQSNLFYIGHSMGTTMFYVMASMRPEYNAKIRAQFSLAPVAFMSNLKSPVIRLMATFEDTLEILMKMVGMHEFLPNSEFLTLVGGVFCNDDAITQKLCDNILFLLCGYDQDQLNTTALPVLLGHIPAGASTNQMVHYAQGVNSAKFRQFSYGLIKNLATYGSLTPPDYDLSKITAPVYLHWSDNDWMADPKDVQELNGKLPNVKGSIRVPYAAFNHLDYMWAIDGKTLLYDTVLENMKKY
uniref:Uncharacterized protein n=1 Tax=Timema monikensis TaxID=170555 RepID=A0A7R9EHK0_9NEOP|nr:unnamed protein product [Timema monikensis]